MPLGDQITAFELIDGTGVGFVRRFFERTDPLAGQPRWRVLAEIIGPAGDGLDDRVGEAFADAFEAGLASDGVLASSEAQRAAMWRLRETIPEANRKVGAVASHDISVPIGRIAGFVAAADAVIAGIDAGLVINCFGHIGDGNLHYNVFPPAGRSAADDAGRRAEVQGSDPRSRRRPRRFDQRRARHRPFQDRRSGPLRRPGQVDGDARHQDRARPARHHEPGRGAGGVAPDRCGDPIRRAVIHKT